MSPLELIARREALGLSQSQLAAQLDVAQNTVSTWERGTRGIPPGITVEIEALEDIQDAMIDSVFAGLTEVDGHTVLALPLSGGEDLPDGFQRVVAAHVLREARADGVVVTLEAVRV